MNRIAIGLGLFVAAFVARPAFPASVSPGGTSAYASVKNYTLTSATVAMTGTLSAGIKNSVIAVHAMATTNNTGNVNQVILLALLNGTLL
jgi:hypothetical protein